MLLRTIIAFCLGLGLGVATTSVEIQPLLWPVISIAGGLLVTRIMKEEKKDWFSYLSGGTFCLLGWLCFAVFLWPIFFPM